MPKQQGTEHVTQCKWQQIAAHILLGHVVKPHQDQRISEKDRVIEKSLCQHQHKTEKRTATMFVRDRVPNFVPRRMCPRSDPRGKQITVAAVCDRRTLWNANLL